MRASTYSRQLRASHTLPFGCVSCVHAFHVSRFTASVTASCQTSAVPAFHFKQPTAPTSPKSANPLCTSSSRTDVSDSCLGQLVSRSKRKRWALRERRRAQSAQLGTSQRHRSLRGACHTERSVSCGIDRVHFVCTRPTPLARLSTNQNALRLRIERRVVHVAMLFSVCNDV